MIKIATKKKSVFAKQTQHLSLTLSHDEDDESCTILK